MSSLEDWSQVNLDAFCGVTSIKEAKCVNDGLSLKSTEEADLMSNTGFSFY